MWQKDKNSHIKENAKISSNLPPPKFFISTLWVFGGCTFLRHQHEWMICVFQVSDILQTCDQFSWRACMLRSRHTSVTTADIGWVWASTLEIKGMPFGPASSWIYSDCLTGFFYVRETEQPFGNQATQKWTPSTFSKRELTGTSKMMSVKGIWLETTLMA